MPELRRDPIIGRWVIIATERAKRPKDFAPTHEELPEGKCPFCEGAESQTPPEIVAIRTLKGTSTSKNTLKGTSTSKGTSSKKTSPNTPGWDVRVVPSIAPVLKTEDGLNRRAKGMYDMMDGVGAHEIVVETPKHIANIADLTEGQIAKVMEIYASRILDLQKDHRFKYVLMFKNYGRDAGGGRIKHSRSQLIATPVTPKRVKEELAGAKRYYDYKERCIFCDIIAQELENNQRLVTSIDGFIAFTPFASRFPFEICITSREHSCDFSSLNKKDLSKLAKILKIVLTKVKNALGDPHYNYILHTAPFRSAKAKAGYWKTIEHDYHWHIEIIPRLTRIAGFEWGTGFYINPTPPEEAAKYLREAKY